MQRDPLIIEKMIIIIIIKKCKGRRNSLINFFLDGKQKCRAWDWKKFVKERSAKRIEDKRTKEVGGR